MKRFMSVLAAGLFLAALSTATAELRAAAPNAAQAAKADDLAAKVKAALDAEPELKGHTITVKAEKETVTLEGEVTSVIARAKAGEVALKIDGVKKVNNKVKLAKSEAGS
jgi:osmotically-inducible protein OsmY